MPASLASPRPPRPASGGCRPSILRPTARNLARLAAALRRGEIVGVPSETVYGLAANALDAAACAGIFTAKGRPTTDPLIVHLAAARELSRVAIPNPAALRLARAFWPGPLTLVLPKQANIPDLVTAGLASVAVRVPDHPLFRQLIRLTGLPLAAPSANLFGYVSPTTADHVRAGLSGTALQLILQGGECRVGVESTIVDLRDPARPRLLRPGGLAAEAIERVLGCKLLRPSRGQARVKPTQAAPAPGMLTQHYSPRTPLILHPKIDQALLSRLPADEAILLLRRPAELSKRSAARPADRIHWLSERGDFATMAHQLFAQLRTLDQGNWQKIHAEVPTSPEGLAPAVRDRLSRAAAKR